MIGGDLGGFRPLGRATWCIRMKDGVISRVCAVDRTISNNVWFRTTTAIALHTSPRRILHTATDRSSGVVRLGRSSFILRLWLSREQPLEGLCRPRQQLELVEAHTHQIE